MQLRKLRVFNFKNYQEAELLFGGRVQCFLGKNGSGKTNLLDAIHYLSFTKSAFNASDSFNIRQGQTQFYIKAEFLVEGKSREVTCFFGLNQKKTITVDGEECTKYSEHVGKFPVVLIAPQDIELIWDGSELRRKFFDSLLSQLDKSYLENLIIYSNQLKQRNALLRWAAEQGKMDYDLLTGYNQKLISSGTFIFEKRKDFLARFLPGFQRHYQFMVGENFEPVEIQYRSELENKDLSSLLSENIDRDLTTQRTTSGIHRDDFLFFIKKGDLKRLGSQGQQKSFLIALKLAEFDVLAERKGFSPLLLLDDIFDKLDDDRIHKLINMVAGGRFGQLFITDARPHRSKEILKAAHINAELFLVENGKVEKNG